MDVEILARLQFAFTIMFHYIYPPLSIGLGLLIVIMEGFYLATKKSLYIEMAKFWTRIFALTFAIGVATGIVMEFEFGTNWATYSRYVGDVFGSALAAEGVFAFFLESGFLALLLFGWNRIGAKLHFFSALMVCLGAHFSAIWIVVANSWMQTPAGFHIVGEGLMARAEILSFWAMVLNPSSVVRLLHVVVGAWLAGAFLAISVSSWYLLKKRHQEFAKSTFKISLSLAAVSLVLQLILGDMSGKIVAEHQPLKLAAMEGLFKTEAHAPLSLIGFPSRESETLDYAIAVPGLLSYIAYDDFTKEVKGLDQFPKKDWPPLGIVFQTYHLMLYMWGAMVFVALAAGWLLFRKRAFHTRWFLRLAVLSVLFPQIANQAGWVAAETGRYPWIVYNLLRISDALSRAVTANQVLGSIILFGIVYTFLFVMFLYLLDQKIRHGPVSKEEEETTFHSMETFAREKHG